MLGSQHALTNGKSSSVQRLGFLVLALIPVERRQIIETACCRGVIRVEYLFINGDSVVVEGLSLFVFALRVVEVRQVIETICRIRMFWTQHLLLNGQCSLEK